MKSKNRDLFPTMRFDQNLRLIDSNLIAQPLLISWRCRKGTKPQPDNTEFRKLLFASLRSNKTTELEVEFSGLRISFDVVPFPEAGFTGVYGHHVETIQSEITINSTRLTR